MSKKTLALQLNVALHQLSALIARLDLIERKVDKIMADLTTLEAAVTRNGDVEQSAVLLLKGLSDQLKAIATDPAKINALADQLKSQSDDLAAAVIANTPAAPTP